MYWAFRFEPPRDNSRIVGQPETDSLPQMSSCVWLEVRAPWDLPALRRNCGSLPILLASQTRYHQTYFFKGNFRRETFFQVFEAPQAGARASRLDNRLPVAVDPCGIKFQFSLFDQIRHRIHNRGYLTSANVGNVFEGFSFRQQT